MKIGSKKTSYEGVTRSKNEYHLFINEREVIKSKGEAFQASATNFLNFTL